MNFLDKSNILQLAHNVAIPSDGNLSSGAETFTLQMRKSPLRDLVLVSTRQRSPTAQQHVKRFTTASIFPPA